MLTVSRNAAALPQLASTQPALAVPATHSPLELAVLLPPPTAQSPLAPPWSTDQLLAFWLLPASPLP